MGFCRSARARRYWPRPHVHKGPDSHFLRKQSPPPPPLETSLKMTSALLGGGGLPSKTPDGPCRRVGKGLGHVG